MRVRVHHGAAKFLEKLDDKNRERIRLKLKALVDAVEDRGVIPFRELDIKRLEGNWRGFLRIRVGGMRIIFRIDKEDDALWVYEIDHRGDVYK